MLHPGRNIHHIARFQFLGRLAPFLVIAPASGYQQNLAAALGGVMDVPMVPAARFKPR